MFFAILIISGVDFASYLMVFKNLNLGSRIFSKEWQLLAVLPQKTAPIWIKVFSLGQQLHRDQLIQIWEKCLV